MENELTSVVNNDSTTNFTYDAAGIRVKTVHPGGKTSYFPFPGYEEEVNGSTTTRRITYAIAGQTVALRVQVVGGSNTLYYLHSDHLGSTSLATTTSGAVVAGSTARYLPFGGWRTTPAAVLTDIGFTGHRHNNLPGSDLGLVYMNARFFMPSIGRFASADTLVPDPANPQQYNRYSYVLNNPLRYSDPTGHSCYNPSSGSPCTLSDGTGNSGSGSLPSPQTAILPLATPLAGMYESGFAWNPNPKRPVDEDYHNGRDLVSDVTTNLRAVAPGHVRVSAACKKCGYTNVEDANYGTGNVVIIEYPYAVIPSQIREAIGLAEGNSVYVQYQHMAAIDASVQPGMQLQRNQILGQYGNTGISQGDHLHLEVHIGKAGILGVDTDGSYKTHNAVWHSLSLVDPALIWNIPTQAPHISIPSAPAPSPYIPSH